MNEIRRIMQTYLSDDFIALTALGEKQDDRVWMTNHGYRTEIVLDGRGFPSGGELTKKGRRFIEESNKEFDRLFERIRDIPIEREHIASRKLIDYSKNRYNDRDVKELSEDERYTFRKLINCG